MRKPIKTRQKRKMRKPNGWIPWHKRGEYGLLSCIRREEHEAERAANSLGADPLHEQEWEIKPICFVPPELLEWVERVRAFLDPIHSGEGILLEELNRIWPEKKDE